MLYFRCDMNEHIATGHVMRCLSIADAAKDKGVEVTFILADESADAFIKSKGYNMVVLFSEWNHMEEELPVLFEKVNFNADDRLIVDSYFVTNKYLKVLRDHVYTVYIDDLGKDVFDVDCIICYAIYADTLNYTERYPKDTRLLLGLDYVPLRKEFRNLPPKHIREKIENLLIMCGGADPYGFIKQLLEKLDINKYKKVNVICGRFNNDFSYLSALYKNNDIVNIIQSTDNIIEYMMDADLAISAAGSTLYELCAVGTPTISYVYADNQIYNAERIDEDDIIKYAGDIKDPNVIEHIIGLLLSDIYYYEYRKKTSNLMQKIVDGLGSNRILENIIQ